MGKIRYEQHKNGKIIKREENWYRPMKEGSEVFWVGSVSWICLFDSQKNSVVLEYKKAEVFLIFIQPFPSNKKKKKKWCSKWALLWVATVSFESDTTPPPPSAYPFLLLLGSLVFRYSFCNSQSALDTHHHHGPLIPFSCINK